MTLFLNGKSVSCWHWMLLVWLWTIKKLLVVCSQLIWREVTMLYLTLIIVGWLCFIFKITKMASFGLLFCIGETMWRWLWPTGCTLACVVVCVFDYEAVHYDVGCSVESWWLISLHFCESIIHTHTMATFVLHFSSLIQRHDVMMDVGPGWSGGSFICVHCYAALQLLITRMLPEVMINFIFFIIDVKI